MSTVRALIVDDERLARSDLRRLLARYPDIEIAGEAANAKEARKALFDLEPDVIFLDVQMPGETGFELLESLDAVPLVIFTTAYDEHALHAFDVSALDYLVKPIEPDRLARSVARVVSTVERSHAGIVHPSEPTPPPGKRVLSEEQRVFLTDGDRSWLVQLGDIRLFESVGNYTRVFFGNEKPLIKRSLNELVEKLDERVFFRANRHQIVNVKAIRSMQAWFNGRLLATLVGGQEITLSRRRARAFREHMSV
jgi:two-component system, LytTR family, response regulator